MGNYFKTFSALMQLPLTNTCPLPRFTPLQLFIAWQSRKTCQYCFFLTSLSAAPHCFNFYSIIFVPYTSTNYLLQSYTNMDHFQISSTLVKLGLPRDKSLDHFISTQLQKLSLKSYILWQLISLIYWSSI